MPSGDDLNAVMVPVYLCRSAAKVLRVMADSVAVRKDLLGVVTDARLMAKSFEQLPSQQGAPPGEHVKQKVQITKIPPLHYRRGDRDKEIRKAFEEQILPAFHRLDAENKGRNRFTLILTWSDS